MSERDHAGTGIIATSPKMAPMQAPRADIFPSRNLSKNIHVIILVADARFVFAKATTASKFAPKAEPALKPNHANQRSPVPKGQTKPDNNPD